MSLKEMDGIAAEANFNPLLMKWNSLPRRDEIKLLSSVRNLWTIPWNPSVSLSTPVAGLAAVGDWVGENVTGTAMKTMEYATIAAVAVPKVATVGLSWYGFTSSGVAAGSLAAVCQSSIGNVAAGSTFAKLTSLGALGGVGWPVGVTAGALVGGTYLGARWWFDSRRGEVKAGDVGVKTFNGAFAGSQSYVEAIDMGMDYERNFLKGL